MSDHQNAGDHPRIEDVDRTFCRAHCAAGVVCKTKRGQDRSYCGKTIVAPDPLCGWSRERIRELMR